MTEETTYQLRDMRFFKDETKGEHLKRMRRAEREGAYEKNEPLKTMVAELLVSKDATRFARMLHRLGLKFRPTNGIGVNSFFIEA